MTSTAFDLASMSVDELDVETASSTNGGEPFTIAVLIGIGAGLATTVITDWFNDLCRARDMFMLGFSDATGQL